MFGSSYRFNLSRSGTPTALGNTEEIQLTLILQPLAFACVPKNDESYDDATRIIALLKIPDRAGNRGGRGHRIVGKGAREERSGWYPRAAGEKAFIARCTILRVLNSFAGVIPRIGNGPQEYTARSWQSFREIHTTLNTRTQCYWYAFIFRKPLFVDTPLRGAAFS